MEKLFQTDGIRGEANVHPMTADVALRLGRALAVRFRDPQGARPRPRILIGKDTRLSGYVFEQALAAGITSMGADVLLCGPLPTPGIAFLTTHMRADAGVVISASHNPYWDNGIKVFGADGFKLPDEDEAWLEHHIHEDTFLTGGARRDGFGRAVRVAEPWARYIVFLKEVLPHRLRLDGLRMVVDCGHGAAYRVAPAVFRELGATVTAIGCDPDGVNINEGCGSLYPERMVAEVRRTGSAIGISLDGDADRVIVADENGTVVDGDQIMALCALQMKAEGLLKNDTVVATVMSNLGLETALRRSGITLLRTQVGDRHVVEAMRRGEHNIGGEQSGHLIFLDHTSTGDGVVAALKILSVMLGEKKPLSELAAVMQPVPQVLVNVRVARKPPIEELPGVSALIRSVEARFGTDGRVLVRYSGTESKARVMIEGIDHAACQAAANEIAAALVAEVGA